MAFRVVFSEVSVFVHKPARNLLIINVH